MDGSETPAPGYVTKTENGSECIKFCNWTLYAFFEDRYGNRLLSIRKHHIKSHAPRGFCSERRDFSLWPGNQGLARRCTWVPPRGWAVEILHVPPPKAAANPAAALPPHGGLGAQNGNFRLHYSSGVTMLCFSVSRRNDSIGEDLIFEICSTIFIADRELFEGGRT